MARNSALLLSKLLVIPAKPHAEYQHLPPIPSICNYKANMASQLNNLSVVAASAQLGNMAYNYNIASGYNMAENDNSAPFYKPA